jgi:amidase
MTIPVSRSGSALSADEYTAYDATGLAELVSQGSASSRELVDAAIARIERYNPRLNAVIHPMFAEARERSQGALGNGPFAGVPFLLKDLLAWYAGEPITSGSRLFQRFVAPHDSEIVKRFRAAGVITLGKTNTPEFGLVPFTEPELFGPTRNPWDTTRTPGGSSGGSAAAVAAGFVPMAGGGDGGGSIRIPASCCGLFGLKPTRGRTPSGPDQGELWRGAAIEHAITRSVRDSAIMLDALAGPDAGAPYFAAPPDRPFAREVDADPGALRIAFTDAALLGHTTHDDCKHALAETVSLLEGLGHTLEEAKPAIDRDPFNEAFLTLVVAELAADLTDAETLLKRKVSRTDLETATWALAMLGDQITAAEYARKLRYLQRVGRAVGQFFTRYDVFLTPTLASPPPPIGSLQPRPNELAMLKLLGRFNAGGVMHRLGALEQAAEKVFDFIPVCPLFNVTGQPAMSVPLCWNPAGLPIGMHFAGRYGDEATLFRLAGQLERARPWFDRRPPLQ